MQAVRGAQKYPNRGFCPYHIHRSKFVPNPITASRIPPQCALRTKSVHRVQNTTILHSEQSVCQIINRMVGIRPTFLLRHLPPRLVFDRTYRALGNIIRSPRRRRRCRRFFFLFLFFFFLIFLFYTETFFLFLVLISLASEVFLSLSRFGLVVVPRSPRLHANELSLPLF